MRKQRKMPPSPHRPVTQPRQINLTFESTRLLGLSAAERGKALMHLAQLLMQAGGFGAAEHDDER
jgi:hypothetical protein